MNKLKLLINIYHNMGISYIYYRGSYEVRRKLGLLKSIYPNNPKPLSLITLDKWRNQTENRFFLNSKSNLKVFKKKSKELKKSYHDLKKGILRFFSIQDINLGTNYDWVTNPTNGYKYDSSKHWTEIEDIISDAGDIKFVWEKSRFSFLYTYIRYDYHFEEDCSVDVFTEIESFIDQNPINNGPNYKCSQEISLRVLNWIFALHYYKNSTTLTNSLFDKIMQSIYFQIDHVYKNINFSRKTVRNNHAISETLTLFIVGSVFPSLPNADLWKIKGKKWFEQEVLYQIYDDGTHLLFSTNYHRAVIQLFTWAILIADINNDKFSDEVYKKIKKAILYLYQITNDNNGDVPNYGPNDGSLFFQLHQCDYRDYRPQLNSIYYYFNNTHLYQDQDIQEEACWLNTFNKNLKFSTLALRKEPLISFKDGGYYLIREKDSFTYIKCGSYKDRPSQADNLHIDIWYEGENIIRDAGTYLYNTSQKLVEYFNGTSAHNTISLGENDQMKKGPRFIWLNWSNKVNASLKEFDNEFVFNGEINAFKQLKNGIFHNRIVTKKKTKSEWVIVDKVRHDTDLPIIQSWNIGETFLNNFSIIAFDINNKPIKPIIESGWFSNYFSKKEKNSVIKFSSNLNLIKTIIKKL